MLDKLLHMEEQSCMSLYTLKQTKRFIYVCVFYKLLPLQPLQNSYLLIVVASYAEWQTTSKPPCFSLPMSSRDTIITSVLPHSLQIAAQYLQYQRCYPRIN